MQVLLLVVQKNVTDTDEAGNIVVKKDNSSTFKAEKVTINVHGEQATGYPEGVYYTNVQGRMYGVWIGTNTEATFGKGLSIDVANESSGFARSWGIASQFNANKVTLGENFTGSNDEKNVNINVASIFVYDPDKAPGDGQIGDYITAVSDGEAVGIYSDSGEFTVGDNLSINATGVTDTIGKMLVYGVKAQLQPHKQDADDIKYEHSHSDINIGKNAKIFATSQSESGIVRGVFTNAGKITLGEGSTIVAKAMYHEKQDGADEEKRNIVNAVYSDTRMDEKLSEIAAKAGAIVDIKAGATIQAINNAKWGEVAGISAHDIVTVGNDSKITALAGVGEVDEKISDNRSIDSYGVYAFSKTSDVKLGSNTDITVINNSNSTVKTADTVGIKAEDSSTVTMAGGSILGKNADTGEFKAIETSTKETLAEGDKRTSVTVGDGNNVVQIEGSLIANNNSDITVNAAFKDNEERSYLLGTITTDGGNRGPGYTSKTNLNLGEGTSWKLTGDSNVTNLDLGNGGIVSMVENTSSNYGGKVHGNAHKLSVDNSLKGSGTFVMDLKYYDNNVKSYENATDSDFIYVHGDNEGKHTIAFEALEDKTDNLARMKPDDKLYFAKMKDDAATFDGGSENPVVVNGKKYNTVTAVNKTSFYDYQFIIDKEKSQDTYSRGSDFYNDWFITCKTNENNPNGDSPFHSYNAGFALWRDDDTLLKRLGELRFTNDEGGVWVRVIGKKLEDNRDLGFNTHAKTIQVGYDRKDVQEDGSGTWRKGFAIGYTEADTTFRSGKGENNYTDLTLYATNIRKHDHYWDLVARIGLINSEYDSAYGDHGDFDNWAGSISAEYGRKKKLNEDNWFIEPQAQLTYSYMWGDNYTTRNGIRVEQGNADSLLGRAGFVISKEIESERKYPHRYYAKAFVMHEFLDGGEGRMFFGGDHRYESCDFKDTWYVVGVGANVDMGNQCTFYFDAEKNFKAHIKMPYRIEAGLRWEF